MTRVVRAPAARQTVLQILHDIELHQAYTDVALRQTLRGSTLDRRDRAFITECVYGVIRWQGRIDWLLAQVCRHPLEVLTPWIRNALRFGVYQSLWMRVPVWAAVDESVQLARRFGHQGTAQLVNGVLRALLRQHARMALPDVTTQPAMHLAVASSHPVWLVERWLQRYGWNYTQALCAANNRAAGITLRTNTLRITRTALVQRLRLEGLRHVSPSTLVPEGVLVQGTDRLESLPSYQEGLFQVQDEGAMLVAPLCQAEPGQRVLDVCAAPGGKTTHLAQLMRDTGYILAFDSRGSRLRLLRDNVKRLDLTSINAGVADATQPLPLRGGFDRILVDAPCSGLGVLRRHPDIKWRKTPVDLRGLPEVQARLLQNQLSFLAPHGMLIYSVCSNEPEETHEVVAQFLAAFPHLRLVPVERDALPFLPGAALASGALDLSPVQCGTEGVFVARFQRREVLA